MKLVPISDIFEIKYGNQFDLNKLDIVEDNMAISFITRSSKNNGFCCFVSDVQGVDPHPAGLITVTMGGTYLLSAFLQDHPFYTAQNIKVLKPKKEMNRTEKLAYCAIIKANRFRFTSHGREANSTFNDLSVPCLEHIQKISKSLSIPSSPSKLSCTNIKYSLDDREWRKFRYDELFLVKKGRRLTKSNMKEGATPYIGSIDSNNGRSASIDRDPIFRENTISVNYNGSVGYAFYQAAPYWASDDCNVIECDKLNPYVGMFISTIIMQEKYRFNYGRKWHKERMEKSTIMLPVDSNGEPDWLFMENYIKALPYSSNL